MGWIDDRIAEQKAANERINLIHGQAQAVYDALWTQMLEYVEEAKSKSIPLLPTQSPVPNDRAVNLSVRPVPPQTSRNPDSFNLHLVTTKEGAKIIARGDRKVNFEFVLDVSEAPKRDVCLKLKEKEISIPDAATTILDQFLFPDLPPRRKPNAFDEF